MSSELFEMLDKLEPEQLKELLKTSLDKIDRLEAQLDDNDAGKLPDFTQNELLNKCYASFSTKNEFKEGQLVQWKPGLKNKAIPRVGEPVVVIEVLGRPIYDTSDQLSATPYFREPLDIILGAVDRDGEFVVYYYDSRRFEPFPAEIAVE